MYARETSQETRTDVLVDAMRHIKLCALVSLTAEGLHASHVPVVIDDQDRNRIILNAHMSRNNPHWRAIGDGADTVAIFQGPHAYITPSWYATKQETGKVVPTWGLHCCSCTWPARGDEGCGLVAPSCQHAD